MKLTTSPKAQPWQILMTMVLFSLAGCHSIAETNTMTDGRILIERIESGQQSGLTVAGMEFRLYTDRDRFARVHGRIHAGTIPKPIAPEVDFERWLVVGAFLGERSSAGYGIELGPAAIVAGDGRSHLEISVTVTEPSSGSLNAQVMTAPYALYKTQRGQWHGIRFLNEKKQVLDEIPVHY